MVEVIIDSDDVRGDLGNRAYVLPRSEIFPNFSLVKITNMNPVERKSIGIECYKYLGDRLLEAKEIERRHDLRTKKVKDCG